MTNAGSNFGDKIQTEIAAIGSELKAREEMFKAKGLDVVSNLQRRFLRRHPNWLADAKEAILSVIQNESGDLFGGETTTSKGTVSLRAELRDKSDDLKEELREAISGKPFSLNQALGKTLKQWVEAFAKPEWTSLECLECYQLKARNLDYLERLDLAVVVKKAGITLPPGVEQLLEEVGKGLRLSVLDKFIFHTTLCRIGKVFLNSLISTAHAI